MRDLQKEGQERNEAALKRAQARLDDVGIDLFRIEAKTQSSDTPANLLVIEKYEQKQKDEKELPKIEREISSLGWTRLGAIAAVVAIPVALASAGLTYWLAKGACS